MTAGEDDPPGVSVGRLALIGVSLALVLTSCAGSSGHKAADGPTTTTASSTSVASSAAVLGAYRAEWAAFEHALTTANAYDPALATTMVDPQLQRVRANLLADNNQGIVGRGSVQLNPHVTSLTGTQATVADCMYSTSELVYQATGKPVPPVTPPEHDGVQATLVLTGSVWKVSQQTVTDGKCAPAE
jgi:hypothetical protein